MDENQVKLAKEVEAAAKAKLKKAKKKAKGDQGGAYFWRSRQEFELSFLSAMSLRRTSKD